jgi:hypothetical protein
MNGTMAPSPTAGSRVGNALRRIARDVRAIYRQGGRAAVAVPVLTAIAVLPEAAQHVVEINLGMFDSREAFRALANDPMRWAFGYAKLAGFWIAILGFARLQATGSLRRVPRVPPAMLMRVAIGIALGFAIGATLERMDTAIGSPVISILLAALSFAIQAGLFLYIAAALIEDRAMTLRQSFTRCFPAAVLLILYAAIAFVPAQALHMANHRLALGQPPAMVWALMAFDALWVGLFAALVGTALVVGARAPLTWRGWHGC